MLWEEPAAPLKSTNTASDDPLDYSKVPLLKIHFSFQNMGERLLILFFVQRLIVFSLCLDVEVVAETMCLKLLDPYGSPYKSNYLSFHTSF